MSEDPIEVARLLRENVLLRISTQKGWIMLLKAGKVEEVIATLERYTDFLVKSIGEQ